MRNPCKEQILLGYLDSKKNNPFDLVYAIDLKPILSSTTFFGSGGMNFSPSEGVRTVRATVNKHLHAWKTGIIGKIDLNSLELPANISDFFWAGNDAV